MSVFVHYDLGYGRLRDTGLSQFNSKTEATAFIESKMRAGCPASGDALKLDQFKVVEGHHLKISEKKVITEVTLVD